MADSIENLISALAKELKSQSPLQGVKPDTGPIKTENLAYTTSDYPMLEKHKDEIRTPTGKGIDDLTLENVLNGNVKIQDVRISREMLYAQAQIAADAGKPAMGENLKRAAELIRVPDGKVISMYNLLRPNRATKQQLHDLADELETQYTAPLCARLVREAASIYEERDVLLK